MLIWTRSAGHWTVPSPTASAPSVAKLLEQETGIRLKFVQVDPADNFRKNLHAAATRNGAWNIVQVGVSDNGDLAEAGLLLNLDEYVAQYRPDWNDPQRGYAGAPISTALLNEYGGSAYSVSFDGDYQVWVYRRDLFENERNRKAFEARYGHELRFPETWQEHAHVARFFTRPRKGLYGSTDLKNPYWGYVNWMQRYVSAAWPNQQYFDEEARPLVSGPAGVRATKEHVASLAWTYPDPLKKGWQEQYTGLGAGTAAMSCAFSNVTRFVARGSPLDRGFAGLLRTELPPGRRIGGELVRRSIVYFNAQFGVNKLSPKRYHEASYLLLQWAGSARLLTWMVGNPTGYYDPNRTFALDDPAVRARYKPRACDKLKETIVRTAPPLAGLQGANEYTQALDVNLNKALKRQLSAEAAMEATAEAWERITTRIGREKQIRALAAHRAAWPKT